MKRAQAPTSHARGFTLIELLVVIAIIAVLIAPAAAGRAGGPRGRPPRPVHQQPEADRPGPAQLPLAPRRFPTPVHEYRRPTSTAGPGLSGNRRAGTASCRSWSRQPIYNAINFSYSDGFYGPKHNIVNGVNGTVQRASIATFLCPSDGDHVPAAGRVGQHPGRQARATTTTRATWRGRGNILMPGKAPTNGNLPGHQGVISTSRMYNTAGPCSPAGKAKRPT